MPHILTFMSVYLVSLYVSISLPTVPNMNMASSHLLPLNFHHYHFGATGVFYLSLDVSPQAARFYLYWRMHAAGAPVPRCVLSGDLHCYVRQHRYRLRLCHSCYGGVAAGAPLLRRSTVSCAWHCWLPCGCCVGSRPYWALAGRAGKGGWKGWRGGWRWAFSLRWGYIDAFFRLWKNFFSAADHYNKIYLPLPATHFCSSPRV